MSRRNPDDARHEDCGREETDDPEPFEEQARDTIETPPVCPICDGQGYTIKNVDIGAIMALRRVPCCVDAKEPQ